MPASVIPSFTPVVSQLLGWIHSEENPPRKLSQSGLKATLPSSPDSLVTQTVGFRRSYAERLHAASVGMVRTEPSVSEEASSNSSDYLGLAIAVGVAVVSPGLFLLGMLSGCGARRFHVPEVRGERSCPAGHYQRDDRCWLNSEPFNPHQTRQLGPSCRDDQNIILAHYRTFSRRDLGDTYHCANGTMNTLHDHAQWNDALRSRGLLLCRVGFNFSNVMAYNTRLYPRGPTFSYECIINFIE